MQCFVTLSTLKTEDQNLLLVLLAVGGARSVPVEAIGDHGVAHQALDKGSIAEVGLSLARSLRV